MVSTKTSPTEQSQQISQLDHGSSSEESLTLASHDPDASQASLATQSSVQSSRRVTPRRQADFEKYFGKQIDPPGPNPSEVIATQSCDFQGSILLHGRLYLTPTHLCFRSNILGYLTEKIHPLKDVIAVQKGTTAKWIQNAVYVVMKDESDPEGVQYGYGSLADREDLYSCLTECWKIEAPEASDAMLARQLQAETVVEESSSAGAMDDKGTVETVEADTSTTATECTGVDHLEELAIDVKFHIGLGDLHKLLYGNRDFLMDFYTNEKQLSGELPTTAGFH